MTAMSDSGTVSVCPATRTSIAGTIGDAIEPRQEVAGATESCVGANSLASEGRARVGRPPA